MAEIDEVLARLEPEDAQVVAAVLEERKALAEERAENQKKLKDFERDNLKYRERERSDKVAALASKYPGLTPEAIGDLPIDRVEALLASVKPADAAASTAPGSTATTPQVDAARVAAFADLSATIGGSGAAGADPYAGISALDANENLRSGRWSPQEFDRFIVSRYASQ